MKTMDQDEAPEGYYAVPDPAYGPDGEKLRPGTPFCASWDMCALAPWGSKECLAASCHKDERADGCHVVFKRKPEKADARRLFVRTVDKIVAEGIWTPAEADLVREAVGLPPCRPDGGIDPA